MRDHVRQELSVRPVCNMPVHRTIYKYTLQKMLGLNIAYCVIMCGKKFPRVELHGNDTTWNTHSLEAIQALCVSVIFAEDRIRENPRNSQCSKRNGNRLC